MAVATILGILSTALARRFVVSPKPGWREPVNIYTLVALPPGNNKSLVLNRCTAPLRDWEIAQALAKGPEIARQKSERLNQERLIESKRMTAVKENDPVARARLFAEVNELAAKVPLPKALPRLFTSDTTPEALAQSVHDQGGRFAIISDEGGITETLSGLYSGGAANIDLILKGIDGGDVRIQRRERSFDLKPFLTFMLVVQPKIIQNMGEKRAFRGNGMLERFVFVIPRSKLGYRTHDTAPVPDGIRTAYNQALRRLLDIQPLVDEYEQEQPRVLALAPEAAAYFKDLQKYIEENLRPGGQLHSCLGWGGKLAGYSLRLAGLLHVAGYGERSTEICAETMARAALLALLLIDHAKAAFHLMGIDQATEDARTVLDWIKARGQAIFRKTECHKYFHGRFTKVERLVEALKILGARNIVTGPEYIQTAAGKRATAFFRVNPLVLG